MLKTAMATTLLLVICSALAIAGSPAGNAKKGEYLYKKACKSCHTDGDIGGKLSPTLKTGAEWQSILDNKQHPQGELAALNEDVLTDIGAFIISHASDSDNPKECY